MATRAKAPPYVVNSFADKHRQFAASFEVRDNDSPFERPLGVDRAAERLDHYLVERRLATDVCRGDSFCNGPVLRDRLCASHLLLAHKARLSQAAPTTAKSYRIGKVGIGQR